MCDSKEVHGSRTVPRVWDPGPRPPVASSRPPRSRVRDPDPSSSRSLCPNHETRGSEILTTPLREG